MDEQNLNSWYVMHNKNLLVSQKEDRRVLQNGISVQDQRGRKDIMVGILECSHPSLKLPNRVLVWYPAYAALPVQLNGKQYFIINYEDVIMTEKISD